MSKKIFRPAETFLIFLVVIVGSVSAQIPPLTTDRPDQTESPVLVPKNHLQIEIGFQREHVSTNQFNEDSYLYPSVLLKFGIFSFLDARFLVEYNQVRRYEAYDRSHSNGFSPIEVGFKLALIEEKGILPKTALIVQALIPKTGQPDYQADELTPAVRLTMQHSITEKMTLGYNIGTEWENGLTGPVYLYTITNGHSLTGKLGGYIELYGFFSSQRSPDHRFDAGFTYLIKPTIQLDISGGIGLSTVSPDNFFGFGVSFRIPD